MAEHIIGEVLMNWYGQNKRDLPWRHTTDPYVIWISEIILQQTRVVQGMDYFNRFMGRFPDVRTLAEAREDEVMKYWQGLGYYSRARNLHAAAKEVVSRFGGVFPKDYEDVLSLPGIGEYTAAAVCSFAYRQPYAVLDGNVFRVLARLFAIDLPIDGGKGKKYFAGLAQELLDRKHPDVYNQAIMDFGAVQCVPKSPDCAICPLNDRCRALAEHIVDKLPFKEGRVSVRSRYFNYLHIRCGEDLLMRQRTAKDIWQKLYEFPLIETDIPVEYEELKKIPEFQALFDGIKEIRLRHITEAPRHVLSHQIIYARFYDIEIDGFSEKMKQYLVVKECETDHFAVSRLIESYLTGMTPDRLLFS